MDIEVKRMSPTAVEMLDQLSAVCKRFSVDYYAVSQNQRDLLDSIALHEYQLKKAHEQGLKRSEVPPFLGLKRSDRSNDMPAYKFACCGQYSTTKACTKPGTFSEPMAQKGSGFLFGWDARRCAGLFIFWYILPCRARRDRSTPSG